jgi:hypothetical protein
MRSTSTCSITNHGVLEDNTEDKLYNISWLEALTAFALWNPEGVGSIRMNGLAVIRLRDRSLTSG